MKIRIENLLLMICFLAAVAPAARGNSAAEIVEGSLRAIGDAKEITKVRNLRAFADCTGPNGAYTTEIFSARGERLIFKQVRAGDGTYVGQTNGQIFWSRDEKSGDFELADRRAALAWRSHDFQRLAMEIATRFRALAFAGEENFAGKAAFKLNAVDEIGNPANLFFDRETHLLLGFAIQNPFKSEPETIRTIFNEWKRVGALRLPSRVTATDQKGDFVLNFREIVLNKTDEEIFAVPMKVTALGELMEFQKQARVAHFTRSGKLLVSTFADDFTSVSAGKISRPAREASLARLQKYFDNSTFIEWDDIAPPVIKLSDDATMGYVLVHKKVRLLAKDESGKETEETEIFAWIEIYRKIKGAWKLTTVASTNTPEADK